jgi:hypothetical protein
MPDERALRIDQAKLSIARQALLLRLDRADRLLAALAPVDHAAALLTLVGEWRSASECEGMLIGLARQADLAPAEMFSGNKQHAIKTWSTARAI